MGISSVTHNISRECTKTIQSRGVESEEIVWSWECNWVWNEVKGRECRSGQVSVRHSITPVEAEEKMTNYPPLTSPKLNSGRFCANKLTMPHTAMHLKLYDRFQSYGFCKLVYSVTGLQVEVYFHVDYINFY